VDTSLFEYFLVLADTLSYTKAADVLYKSESVLSRQISKLENELNIKLFERNKRAVSLTPAGKAFKKGLEALGRYYGSLLDETRAIQSGYSGVLKIASPNGVMLHNNMVRILMEFEKDYPHIRIDLRTYGLSELRTLLLDQQIDFAYGTTGDFSDNPAFSRQIVGHAEICMVMPKKYLQGKKEPGKLSLYDFREHTFMFIADQKSAIDCFNKQCAEAGFTPNTVTAADNSMLMLWVAMQRGIALLGESYKFRDNEDLTILSMPALGYLNLGIAQNTNNLKDCNKVFFNYVREKSAKMI
jgi:DNA-binding transcriptional LysR family regulator